MRSLKIIKPHVASYYDTSGGMSNTAALASPDPREIVVFGSASTNLIADMGEPKIVDCLFLGYNTFGGGAYITQVLISNDPAFATYTTLYGGFPGDNSLSVSPVASAPRFAHGLLQFATMGVGRYIYVTFQGAGSLGVFAPGNSFTARWGQEMGSGRPLLDRSSVEALPLGGFGIDPGAITGGYQWSFGDLQQSEVTALYQIIKSVGQSRSVLVIEDPDFVYQAPSLFGSANFSGTAKTIVRTGGANGYNSGANTPLRQGIATGISWKYSNAAGNRVGFYPGAGGAVATLPVYAIEVTPGGVARYVGGAGVSIGPGAAANERFSVAYSEGRQQFVTYRGGVVVDAISAATDLALYPTVDLFSFSAPDKVEEFNVFDLGYEDRIHWGLLQKLDTFERADPANWRWSLAVGDWV